MKESKNKTNKLAILSIITSIIVIAVSLILLTIDVIEINIFILILCMVCVILSFTTIILSILSREQVKRTKEKGKTIVIITETISMVLCAQFIGLLLSICPMLNVANNDKEICKNVYECVKGENGVSKCDTPMNIKKIRLECTTNGLNEDQFKK